MTNKLKWRLGKLPTSDEVLKLVNDKVISKEEARDILFKEELENEVSKTDLESEIKFLRELVEKLSNGNRNVIVETIKYVEKPYCQWNWYKPYAVWTGSINDNVMLCSGTNQLNNTINTNCNFSSLETF